MIGALRFGGFRAAIRRLRRELWAMLALLACTTQEAPPAHSVDSATAAATATAAQALRDTITMRLAGYTDAARRVDAEASAAYFAPDGVLFEPGIPPIVSPDSIRAFIKSFPGVTVDSAIAVADTIEIHPGMALVWGHFFEQLHFPGQPMSAQHGRFVMQWVPSADGNWRIRNYYRVPLPPAPPAASAPAGAKP